MFYFHSIWEHKWSSDWNLNRCYLLFRFNDNRPLTLDTQILPGLQLIRYGNDDYFFFARIQYSEYRTNCARLVDERQKKKQIFFESTHNKYEIYLDTCMISYCLECGERKKYLWKNQIK